MVAMGAAVGMPPSVMSSCRFGEVGVEFIFRRHVSK